MTLQHYCTAGTPIQAKNEGSAIGHGPAGRVEDRDVDPSADPDDPALHLQRQLNRIRNGEDLDRITTRLR